MHLMGSTCTCGELVLSVLQEDLKSPTFLQDKLKQYFLENTHQLTLVMTPDVRMCMFVHTYVCVCMYVCLFVYLYVCTYEASSFVFKGSDFFAGLHVYIWP